MESVAMGFLFMLVCDSFFPEPLLKLVVEQRKNGRPIND